MSPRPSPNRHSFLRRTRLRRSSTAGRIVSLRTPSDIHWTFLAHLHLPRNPLLGTYFTETPAFTPRSMFTKRNVVTKIRQQYECQSMENHLHKAFIIWWKKKTKKTKKRCRATHRNMDASQKHNIMCENQVTQNIFRSHLHGSWGLGTSTCCECPPPPPAPKRTHLHKLQSPNEQDCALHSRERHRY